MLSHEIHFHHHCAFPRIFWILSTSMPASSILASSKLHNQIWIKAKENYHNLILIKSNRKKGILNKLNHKPNPSSKPKYSKAIKVKTPLKGKRWVPEIKRERKQRPRNQKRNTAKALEIWTPGCIAKDRSSSTWWSIITRLLARRFLKAFQIEVASHERSNHHSLKAMSHRVASTPSILPVWSSRPTIIHKYLRYLRSQEF